MVVVARVWYLGSIKFKKRPSELFRSQLIKKELLIIKRKYFELSEIEIMSKSQDKSVSVVICMFFH